MDEDSIIAKAARELGVEKLVPTVYQDLLQPSVKQVGDGLVKVAKAVCIATAPFELATWGYERIKENLAVSLTGKLAKVSPENIVTPKLNIAGPVLNNFPLVSDEKQLRDFYANLLASAMNKETLNTVHPSFAFIIQELSSEEALLLKWLSDQEDKGRLCDCISNAETGDMEDPLISEQFSDLCIKAGLSNREMFGSYLENLTRLRILYQELRSDAEYIPEGAGDWKEPASVATYYRDTVSLTEFGLSFIKACAG